MVKEYLSEKLSSTLEKISSLEERYKESSNRIDLLEQDIYRMQEESNINFEVFYPRSGSISLQSKINQLSCKLQETSAENKKIKRTLKELEQKRDKYQYMIDEITELEKRSKHRAS